MSGWDAWQRQTEDGAVESEQRMTLTEPVVEVSTAGAERLGRAYWLEVERFTHRVVRARETSETLELRLLGTGPPLLRFGRRTLESTTEVTSCSYPIEGGFLARRPTGEIVLAQTGGTELALSSTIRGFFPRLAARERRPDWTGALYNQVQSRIHIAISRRYFARLIAEARR